MSAVEPATLDVLDQLILRLRRASVPYVATGSLAFAFHVPQRPAREIDIIVEIARDGAIPLTYALGDRFDCDLLAVQAAAVKGGTFTALDKTSSARVSIGVRSDAPYHREAFRRRRAVGIEGRHVWMTSPEDLLVWSLLRGNDANAPPHEDIHALAALTTLQWDYLTRWAPELGLAERLDELHRGASDAPDKAS